MKREAKVSYRSRELRDEKSARVFNFHNRAGIFFF